MVRRATNPLFEDFGCARFVQGAFLRRQRLTDGADAERNRRRTFAIYLSISSSARKLCTTNVTPHEMGVNDGVRMF